MLVGLTGVVVGSCMPPDDIEVVSGPVTAAPVVGVLLQSSATRPVLEGPLGLVVRTPGDAERWIVAPATRVEVMVQDFLVSVRIGGRQVTGGLLQVSSPDSNGTILIDGKAYRGILELSRGADGVQVVNRVDLEDYLVAVVGAEMGRRTPEEQSALEAQAVASRTFALRHLDRDGLRGHDLLADVSSQVYGGVASELPLARIAVEHTRGEILTVDGEPIDAFFSSTCGGHSESSGAVFSGGQRNYLPARPDLAPDGNAWCAISPAFRWQQRWTGAEITAILQRTLAAERLGTARATDLREVRTLDRTASGRISQLELVGSNGRTVVNGSNTIRRVLAPPGGAMLRSADFTIRITRQGGRIERLEAEGRGYGHGVGMCQWGAIGRARAGQGYAEILMGYYPGVELRRVY